MFDFKEHNITPFDKNRWVLKTNDGNHLLINNETRELLNMVIESSDLDSSVAQFNKRYAQSFSLDEFKRLIIKKFGGSGVLVNYESRKKKSYMSLKIPLLNSKIAGYLSSPFKSLFKPIIFWLSLTLYISFLIFLYFKYFSFDFSSIRFSDIITFSILFYSSMLVHELGHISACKYFKVQHGEIGFGFYLVFPVVYAQITNVWSLNKHNRIIVNLGGIYLELFYACILSLLFLLFGKYTYLYVSLLIFLKILTELNPFIRYDGYWILSDITNTPNLLPKSTEAIRTFFSNDKKSKLLNKRGFLWLLIYGSVNFMIIGVYLSWVLVNHWSDILDFPYKIILAGYFGQTMPLFSVKQCHFERCLKV